VTLFQLAVKPEKEMAVAAAATGEDVAVKVVITPELPLVPLAP